MGLSIKALKEKPGSCSPGGTRPLRVAPLAPAASVVGVSDMSSGRTTPGCGRCGAGAGSPWGGLNKSANGLGEAMPNVWDGVLDAARATRLSKVVGPPFAPSAGGAFTSIFSPRTVGPPPPAGAAISAIAAVSPAFELFKFFSCFGFWGRLEF